MYSMWGISLETSDASKEAIKTPDFFNIATFTPVMPLSFNLAKRYIAIACSISLSISGIYLTGEEGKHPSYEGWKALVDSGLANTPQEAHIWKRAHTTTTAPISTGSSTATTTTEIGPSPWVSLDTGGSPVMVNPVITTDAEGNLSTTGLASTSIYLTESDKDDQTHHIEIECTESSYQDGARWVLFCLLHNGSE
ncbi:hypothetical protein L211DRAFT_868556 [Terfezia boudieri ATCC MYA-4762]|uniref:Uncharacterized protein n=1 Tax=Terfezia boudieri ATCC MYA-4762 TaxID=1051890 RepID=A0A3N4LS06_9PEZI|nr:hypothetical protein L211DRAFT_868556 [Terfezia boudieri ATCC MYA-4762]